MLTHVIHSFAVAARMTIHVQNMKGSNDHHKAESAFKVKINNNNKIIK